MCVRVWGRGERKEVVKRGFKRWVCRCGGGGRYREAKEKVKCCGEGMVSRVCDDDETETEEVGSNEVGTNPGFAGGSE